MWRFYQGKASKNWRETMTNHQLQLPFAQHENTFLPPLILHLCFAFQLPRTQRTPPHPTAFMPISRPQELDIAGVNIGVERLLHDSPFWAQGVARKTAQKMVK